jgi:adenosylcobinamide-GDP ribazoletransferase
MLDNFLTALGFLTIIPVRVRRAPLPGDLGRAAPWFPLVGLLIGAINTAGWLLFTKLFPPFLAAVLTVALWAFLTGALHLDGLADCCDGFFPAVSKERRLEIMRDPHTGAFGVAGLVLFLMMKTAAVEGLSAAEVGLALIAAPVAARFLLLPAGLLKTARADGLGNQFTDGLTRRGIVIAAALPLAVLVISGWWFLAAGLFAATAAAGVLSLARARIGGVSGDVLGMTLEVSELAFLLFICLRLP